MPQVDHRISQSFKCVVQLAQAFEPQQQTPELILPSEHALDGVETLFKNGGVEQRLAATLGYFSTAWIRVDVRGHPAIENRFAINPAIVDAIQADNGSLKIKADSIADARHKRQGFPQERRFIAIARRRNKRRDHGATPIAENDDLVTLHFFVTTEPDVVAAFLRGCRRSIAMNDGCVEKIGVMKRRHRVSKNGVKAAIGLPLSKRAIDARVMNFRTTVSISFDRQFFPLAPQIEHLQNVIEDRMHREFWRRASASGGKMGQDKLLELLNAQFLRNRPPFLAFRHFSSQINWNISRVGRYP